MDTGTLILIIIALALWFAIWYGFFYHRYGDKQIIDDLRARLSDYQQNVDLRQSDLVEYEQQNLLLKEKVTDLLIKNDDLTKIVSELYRYYFRIKDGYEKAAHLAELLKVFDKDFETKIKNMSTLGESRIWSSDISIWSDNIRSIPEDLPKRF